MPDNPRNVDLSIDPDDLPVEWQNQATLMLYWSGQCATASMDLDRARAALALIDAKLAQDIRNDPIGHGLTKDTESTVAAAVVRHGKHRDAEADVIKAKYRYNVLRGVVDAIEHRKRSLQGMTDLWLRNYYADPRRTSQPDEVHTAAETNAMTQVNSQRRRRVKR